MDSQADDLRERVRQERTRRSLSIRRAATLGGISNETWGRYEDGGPLTPAVRAAVVRTFGWPPNWPENPPPVDNGAMLTLGPDTQNLLDSLTALARADGRLEDRLTELGQVLDELEARVGRLERRRRAGDGPNHPQRS